MALLHQIEAIFQLIVQYGVLLLECAGVAVLLITAVKSIIGYAKRKPHRSEEPRLNSSHS